MFTAFTCVNARFARPQEVMMTMKGFLMRALTLTMVIAAAAMVSCDNGSNNSKEADTFDSLLIGEWGRGSWETGFDTIVIESATSLSINGEQIDGTLSASNKWLFLKDSAGAEIGRAYYYVHWSYALTLLTISNCTGCFMNYDGEYTKDFDPGPEPEPKPIEYPLTLSDEYMIGEWTASYFDGDNKQCAIIIDTAGIKCYVGLKYRYGSYYEGYTTVTIPWAKALCKFEDGEIISTQEELPTRERVTANGNTVYDIDDYTYPVEYESDFYVWAHIVDGTYTSPQAWPIYDEEGVITGYTLQFSMLYWLRRDSTEQYYAYGSWNGTQLRSWNLEFAEGYNYFQVYREVEEL